MAYPAVGTTLTDFATFLEGLGYAAEDLVDGRPINIAALSSTDTLLLKQRRAS